MTTLITLRGCASIYERHKAQEPERKKLTYLIRNQNVLFGKNKSNKNKTIRKAHIKLKDTQSAGKKVTVYIQKGGHNP